MPFSSNLLGKAMTFSCFSINCLTGSYFVSIIESCCNVPRAELILLAPSISLPFTLVNCAFIRFISFSSSTGFFLSSSNFIFFAICSSAFLVPASVSAFNSSIAFCLCAGLKFNNLLLPL